MTRIRLTMLLAVVGGAFSAACSGPQAVTEARATPAAAPAAPAPQSSGSSSLEALPAGHPPIDGSASQSKKSGPIEPAKNGLTVETIWKTRETLAGKTVVVRGRVVKFNGGILGANWIHVQDGTGSAEARTNDITITSDEEAAVGDVITVTGTVGLNKDLGSGYSYPVIIEKARLDRGTTAR